MGMVKKSISVTEQQDNWIKAQIKTGHFGNESEIIRELIRERQMREQETPAQIEAIRAALGSAGNSGRCNEVTVTSDKSMKTIIIITFTRK